MDPFVGEFERRINDRQLLAREESILVAVSGGLDSMVLLRLLSILVPKYQWRLTVAHFNHQLRGRSSDADERFVLKIAATLGLSVAVEAADVNGFAREKKLSIEMAARQLRHEFFARAAQRLGIRKVALAHHADDQVELFFLRLLRGSGGEGLSGMDDMCRSPITPDITLVRPLLGFSRQRLAGFAAQFKIPFREDASNRSIDYQRNRMRHNVLPVLQREQPALAATVLRSMEILAAEADFAAEAAREFLKSSRSSFEKLHIAVQRRVVQTQLQAVGLGFDFDLIEKLRRDRGKRVDVGPGRAVVRDKTGKISVVEVAPVVSNAVEVQAEVSGKGTLGFGHLEFCWSLEPSRGTGLTRAKGCEFFDARKVGGTITLRHWRAGDRFQPIGMPTPVKLQDLFTNAKVPRPDRHRRVVAVTVKGEIMWVEGMRISERFKLDNDTRQRLKWCWKPI
jgi:tRNA(Ile)-lysidine synthase